MGMGIPQKWAPHLRNRTQTATVEVQKGFPQVSIIRRCKAKWLSPSVQDFLQTACGIFSMQPILIHQGIDLTSIFPGLSSFYLLLYFCFAGNYSPVAEVTFLRWSSKRLTVWSHLKIIFLSWKTMFIHFSRPFFTSKVAIASDKLFSRETNKQTNRKSIILPRYNISLWRLTYAWKCFMTYKNTREVYTMRIISFTFCNDVVPDYSGSTILKPFTLISFESYYL